MAKAVGIDLGTTNSVVAVMEDGAPVIIPNTEGDRTTPSVVAYEANHSKPLVGRAAAAQASTNFTRTVSSVKREMGTQWSVVIDDHQYSPQDISAEILKKLKRDAEKHLETKVTEAVITVPAYFDHAQRSATKQAGELAGLKVLRLISEPTAAGLAYVHNEMPETDQIILVFDLGGGTFDVTIFKLWNHGVREVLATSGNTRLGGDDWDDAVVKWLIKKIKRDHRVKLDKDSMAKVVLKEVAEKAKCVLSTRTKASIKRSIRVATTGERVRIDYTLSRSEFEKLTRNLLKQCREPFQQALSDAGLDEGDLDEVVLAGGSTRMPAVHEVVRELTGLEPREGVDPDEIVAAGAAIQAAWFNGEVDLDLSDVVPLSLGTGTVGDVMDIILDRNTPIPFQRSELYTTVEDFQLVVRVDVWQGESPVASANELLGTFPLHVGEALRGVPQIEVTFDVDENAILNVSAEDLGTGRREEIVIADRLTLSEKEIALKKKKARANAEKDEETREAALVEVHAEELVYCAEVSLELQADQVDPIFRDDIIQRVADVKDALTKRDTEEIAMAGLALSQAAEDLPEPLYQIGDPR